MLIIVVTLVGTLVLTSVLSDRKARYNMKCKSNLRHLGTAMVQYIDQFGKGRYYTWPGPQKASFNGAQWIASLYWVGLLNEPDIYLCSKSGDENDMGCRLGRKFTALSPTDVSYAGRNGIMGAIVDKMPTSTVMMSDDDEGVENHDDGVNVLFFDCHVEFTSQVRSSDVGRNKPLDMLRN